MKNSYLHKLLFTILKTIKQITNVQTMLKKQSKYNKKI